MDAHVIEEALNQLNASSNGPFVSQIEQKSAPLSSFAAYVFSSGCQMK